MNDATMFMRQSPIDDVEKIINLAVDCGIEKDDKLFYYAIGRVLGEQNIRPEFTFGKLMPIIDAVIKSLNKALNETQNA